MISLKKMKNNNKNKHYSNKYEKCPQTDPFIVPLTSDKKSVRRKTEKLSNENWIFFVFVFHVEDVEKIDGRKEVFLFFSIALQTFSH